MKLLLALFIIVVIYVGLGVIMRFVYCSKNPETPFALNEETVMYVLKWPKHLKDF